MNRWHLLCGWVVTAFLVVALAQPGQALAGDTPRSLHLMTLQDDDDDDDGFDDDADADDGDGSEDGDDDDDDVEAPPPAAPPAQAPAGQDDDDSDDDDLEAPPPAPVIQDDVETPAPPPAVVDDDDDDEDDDGFDRPVPNQAIVQLQPGVDPYAFAGRYDATVLRVIPGPNIALLQLDPGLSDDAEVSRVTGDAQIIWGEQNFTSQAPEGRPRYFFTSTAGVPRVVDGPALPQGMEFTPQEACATGTDVVVAVLDTGVDVDHPAIATSVLPNGVNMVDNTFDVRDDGNGQDDDGDGQVDEMVGHGTHVSGTITQVAPGVAILPVKVLNSDGVGDDFTVTAGIYYAVEQGAGVINLSLGSTFDSRAVQSAVDFAAGNGVVVIAAAGNGDRLEPVEYPAADDVVVSVASTTATGDKAAFSNYHPTVDISAPGVDVASAYPGGLYTTASGTSMSTALVSGAAALLLERQPGIGPERVLQIVQTASGPLSLTDPALEGLLGAGELDIDASIACGRGGV